MTHLVGMVIDVSVQELVATRKRVDWLKYMLEQEKVANTKLIKEIDYCEEAL